jgi:cytochrome b6-f complex iron-sulfur subunit
VLGAAATLAAAPALTALGCARRIAPSRDLAVGAPADGNLVVTRAQAPELERIGGSVVLRPCDGSEPILLANAGDDFLALQARCPHAGCELTWVQEDKQAECPCHGSRFASDGTVLNPPARTNAPAFPVTVDRTTLEVIVHLKAGDGRLPAVKDGKVTFTLDDHPELQSVGGAVVGKPDGFGRPLIVLRFSDAEVRAFDATCTHLDCAVHHDYKARNFQCPCHGSLYSEDGTVQKGPAQRSLTGYAAQLEGRVVTVTLA